jgi:N-acetylglucosaminyldiphosphoundecaprenol N-acetyl-beta-D-mannosaminyltransferase
LVLISYKNNMKQITIWDIIKLISVVENLESQNDLIKNLNGKTKIVSFINLHAVYLGLTNKPFLNSIHNSDFVLRDGVGVSILLKLYGRKNGLNMVGTDFIPTILNTFKDKKIVLIGTDVKTVETAEKNLQALNFNIIARQDGFQSVLFYLEFVIKHKPDIIVLGMGMPKQELVSLEIKNTVNYECLIINGGAIIDFIGNKVTRAPSWMRRARLEWFYRFIFEPRRLFKRYFIEPILLLPYFVKDIFRK